MTNRPWLLVVAFQSSDTTSLNHTSLYTYSYILSNFHGHLLMFVPGLFHSPLTKGMNNSFWDQWISCRRQDQTHSHAWCLPSLQVCIPRRVMHGNMAPPGGGCNYALMNWSHVMCADAPNLSYATGYMWNVVAVRAHSNRPHTSPSQEQEDILHGLALCRNAYVSMWANQVKRTGGFSPNRGLVWSL